MTSGQRAYLYGGTGEDSATERPVKPPAEFLAEHRWIAMIDDKPHAYFSNAACAIKTVQFLTGPECPVGLRKRGARKYIAGPHGERIEPFDFGSTLAMHKPKAVVWINGVRCEQE